MKPYEVLPGDTLWEIAIKHGFRSHTELLDVPENKALFENSERDENRIFPGDVIHFPQKTVATFEAKTNGKRVFRTPSKKGFIRLEVLDALGNPLEYFRYEAEMFGQTFSGDQNTFDGHIEIEVPQKKNGNKVLMPGEKSEEDKAKKLTGNNKLKSETAEVKLYTNKDDIDFYELYRVHISYEPRDEKEGALKQLANHGVNNGLIPGVPYESELGRINNHCYAEDDWVQQQIEPMEGDKVNTELTPIPSAINFQPQYYPVVWEMLRYERLYKLSDQSFRHFESEVDALKSSREPYDASYALMVQAEMDLEYYQYCFNYWFSEFSSLWNGHVQKDSAADSLLRFRSHVYVEKKLTEITQRWRLEFEGENVSDEILHKPFPTKDIEHVPQLRDLFTTYYNTQQAKDKLATKIVSPPLTSRVRFSYQDDPEKPIANSFVLYWRYDKADDTKIETGREEFYNHARIMMPIGIGKTDSQGYLVQSMPFTGDDKKGFINTSDGHFTMHAGLESNEGLSHDHLQPFMAKFESVSDAQRFINDIKPLEGQWNDMFNQVNRRGGQKIYRRALFHIRNNFNAIQDSETYDEQVNKLLEYADSFENRYEIMRTSIANAYFNYYSSGSTDTWGFMVYPPDAGLMRTADLAKLGNEGKYAYKGPIRSPKDQHEFIQLPCTLQEWERRLKVQSEKLKHSLEQYQKHTSNHRQNVDALGRMEALINLYEKYPYEYEVNTTLDERKELKAKVKKLSSEISGLMQSPHEQKDKYIHAALKNMDESSNAIIELLQNSDFADQLELYQSAYNHNELDVSPYMEADQTWVSIYSTIADAIGLLAMCPKAGEAYENLIQPVLNNLVNSKVVTKAMKDGLGGLASIESADQVDTISVNKKGDVVEESLSELIRIVDSKYSGPHSTENAYTVLDRVFASQFYNETNELRLELNKWVNSTPGTPSVLFAMLDGFMTYVIADAQKNGAAKGFHIRLLMMASEGFGLFSGSNGASKSGILGVLKSNDVIRLGTKIEVQKGLLMQVDDAILDSKKAIERTRKQIDEVEGLLDDSKHSRKLQLNNRLKKLKEYLKKNEKAFEARDAEVNRLIQVQRNKQSGLVGNFEERRLKAQRSHSDEFYKHADGQLARVYKTTLTLINVAAVIEDWAKVSRAWDKHELGLVDIDIVMAETMKTVCETTKTSASAILLINRWAGTESKIFGDSSWLKGMGGAFDSIANKAAVGVSILSLYVSSRELYESFNNTLLVEKIDSFLSIAADAMTVVGYAAVNLNIAGLAFLPVVGQILMVIGAVLVVASLGYEMYRKWVSYNFIENGPVGYYFWEEFKFVRVNSQRYSNEDFYVSENESVVQAFNDLYAVANGDEQEVLEHHEGWGHLSWRAAIILYRQWRNMSIGRAQLKAMIKDLCRTPDTIISNEKIDRGSHSTTNIFKLISPSGMLSFYCYLEQKVESEPHGSWVFESSGLSYRAVMSLMEQGLYVPRGEANELLDHLKSDYIVKVSASGQASRHARYEHRVIWDHEVFSQIPKT